MDVGGEYSGTVSGVMNMAGSLAASISPIVFGVLVQRGLVPLRLPWLRAISPLVKGARQAMLGDGTARALKQRHYRGLDYLSHRSARKSIQEEKARRQFVSC